MSMNWREIALVLQELPLEGSLIQRVHQIGFHALVWELHHPKTGAWQLYVEVGTPDARLHRLTGPVKEQRKRKTRTLQRFIQYIRAHVEGGRILSVSQAAKDRLVLLEIVHGSTKLHLLLRFYSGPGANVIICDDRMMIKELLFRRPGRKEIAGEPFIMPAAVESDKDDDRFPVRPYPADMEFNRYLEMYYAKTKEETLQELLSKVEVLRDKRIGELRSQLEQLELRCRKTSGFESYRISGDILSASVHLVKPGSRWVEVPDYSSPEENSTATIALDPTLSPGGNIAAYYEKYRKGRTSWEHADAQRREIEGQLEQTKAYFDHLLNSNDITILRQAVQPAQSETGGGKADPFANAPGLRFTSSLFTILVGRNSKENDTLLRKWARGNDWWLHTRDVPGGYVIIKTIPGKTIPLDTILDAGNLAILYSKAKEARKADLYYTQVKYLKRPKGGKQGLVLPTQEKNLTMELDDGRIERLFSQHTSGDEAWKI